MNDNYVELLGKIDLFEGICREDVEKILGCFNPKIIKYDKNDYIISAGQPFAGLGIVIAGEAIVIKDNDIGTRIIMKHLKAGNIFGEMIVFSKKMIWTTSVHAQCNCEVLFFPKENLLGTCDSMCEAHKKLLENFISIISERSLFLMRKIEYLSIKNTIGKISAFLYDQYMISGKNYFEIAVNRNDLADFLNISRPTLSRELAKMKEDGIIDYYLKSFKITDMEKLKSLTII